MIHSFFADGPFPLKFGKIAKGDLPFQHCVSEKLKSVCLRRSFKIFEKEEKNLRQLHRLRLCVGKNKNIKTISCSQFYFTQRRYRGNWCKNVTSFDGTENVYFDASPNTKHKITRIYLAKSSKNKTRRRIFFVTWTNTSTFESKSTSLERIIYV